MTIWEKSVPAGRLPSRRQAGAALLIFLILLVTGGLAYLVSGLTSASADARRTQQTEDALNRARDALIGYALQYRERQIATGTYDAMYGYLPMPDVGTSRFHASQPASCNTEGCAMRFINGAFPADTDTVIGRLPWKTLGLEPLRDGHGECLWYIVSANHKDLGISTTVRMNWDALSHLDVVVANGGAALASALASAHERPVAVIFSPGPALPGQDRSNSASDGVARCGGNYDVVNYLDPSVATALGGTTNYLAGSTNSASGTTDATAPKGLSTQGRVYAAGSNFFANACEGANCKILANDRGLGLGGDMLFNAIRKSAYFRTDINSMLDRMVNCLRDQPPLSGTAARIPDSTCYDTSQAPRGYYDHYKEMIFLARPSVPFTVNGDNTCAAALIFAGQRDTANLRCPSAAPASVQKRSTAAEKNDFCNYLEGANLANFSATGTAFGSVGAPTTLERSPTQAAEQDIVRCVPSTPSIVTVTSAALGVNQIVSYDTATRTLTLGRQDVVTSWGYDANALFGCGWFSDSRTLSNGLRSYFRFQFKRVGTSVGSNGFVFALADALKNNLNVCGAGGSHLGYSGDNGVTPKISFPKIGIEFDQSRNTGFSEFASLALGNPGRNDPCGASSCGGTAGYNSHAAIVFWGHEVANAIDGVTRPNDDDNVHGFPTVGSIAGTRQPPRSHASPATETGIKFINLRDNPVDSSLFHVRVELTPTRTANADASLSRTAMDIQVWIADDASTSADRKAALKDTTRAMSVYDATFAPTLTQTADLYDVQEAACSSGTCPSGQTCGSDNMCYRPALERIQLGFTGSQRTSDQQVEIYDLFTTWLP